MLSRAKRALFSNLTMPFLGLEETLEASDVFKTLDEIHFVFIWVSQLDVLDAKYLVILQNNCAMFVILLNHCIFSMQC